MPGFWDRFAEAYEPASRQSAAHALKMLASKKQREEERAIFDEQYARKLKDNLNTSLLQSNDPSIIASAGDALIKSKALTQEQLTPIIQRAQVSEVTKLLQSDQPIGPRLVGLQQYSPSVIERATSQAMIEAKEKDKAQAEKDEQRAFEVAKALPEKERRSAFQAMGYGLPDIVKQGLSEEDRKSFELHYKGMREDKTILGLKRVNALYTNLVGLLQAEGIETMTKDELQTLGLRQIGALNNLHKMSDDSVLRQDDVEMVRARESYVEKFLNIKAKLAEGHLFGPVMTAAMGEVADDILIAAHEAGQRVLNDYMTSLDASKAYNSEVIEALRKSSEHIITMPPKRWESVTMSTAVGRGPVKVSGEWFDSLTAKQQEELLKSVHDGKFSIEVVD